MLLKRLLSSLTSLRLTIICLTMSMILVFVGTIAQVKLGLWVAQEQYFYSYLVFWTPPGTQLKIPVWPGGYLLGWVLLVNLIAAHIKRFTFSRKKIGIFIIHAGLILLLMGQFFTQLFQVESSMRLEEGQSSSFTEDNRRHELVVIDVTDPATNRVVAITESALVVKSEIRHPSLPFVLKCNTYFPNSWFGRSSENPNARIVKATHGIGERLPMREEGTTAAMNDENKPAALIEVVADGKSLGQWTVSTWFTKYPWVKYLRENLESVLGRAAYEPQGFGYGGRLYEIAIRPVRYYHPYSLQLVDFSHDRYKGTEIPKNFSSHIQLKNAETGENREVLIYMNNPLRYSGKTYYQGSFEPGDKTSILHVVRNPAWLTPYFSCVIVGIGLLVQFLSHLIGFTKRTAVKNKSEGTKTRDATSGPPREPVAVGSVGRNRSGPSFSAATTTRRTP